MVEPSAGRQLLAPLLPAGDPGEALLRNAQSTALVVARTRGINTVSVWFRSLFTGNPNVDVITRAPIMYQVHATAAWAIFAMWPFSRLVHAWSYPLWYLWRPYIVFRSPRATPPPEPGSLGRRWRRICVATDGADRARVRRPYDLRAATRHSPRHHLQSDIGRSASAIVVNQHLTPHPHAIGEPVNVEAPIRHDMSYWQRLQQHGVVRDQPAVAAPPHALAAHHRGWLRASLVGQHRHGRSERRGAHVRGVRTERLVAQRGIR
jgi:Nitrate reductase gamma subunit